MAQGDRVASERRRDADWYEQELKRQELAAARRLTGVLPSDQTPRPGQLAQAGKVMDRSVRELGRLRHSLEGELERVQGRSRSGGDRAADGRGRRQPAASRRLHPEVPRYYAVRNAIDEVLERWERRRDQLSAAAGKQHAAPSGKRQPAQRSKGQHDRGRERGKDPARARR
jgi:hypothetical protein